MIKLTNKEYNDLLVKIEEGTKFTVKYLKEYEQQKQRADELERRWSKLSELVNERTEKYYEANMTAYFTLNAIKRRMAELQEDDND